MIVWESSLQGTVGSAEQARGPGLGEPQRESAGFCLHMICSSDGVVFDLFFSLTSCFGPLVNGLLFPVFPVLNPSGMTMLLLMGLADMVGLKELRGPFEIPFVFCGP